LSYNLREEVETGHFKLNAFENVFNVNMLSLKKNYFESYYSTNMFILSTYNKQWHDAQLQINDLLEIENPKVPPKPETVNLL